LGIGPDRPVLLASAVHLQRGGLRPMLEGVVEARRGQPSLVVVIAGRRTHAIETEAQKAGCIDSVRIIGATSRMDALLAAADLAVSPWVGSGLSGGRFVADALRLGCPVLAHRGSPGAELVEPTHFGTPELGGIVARATAQAWAQAIGETLSRERLTGAERAARDAGAVVSMDAMAARVESILAAAQQG
jgi:glycosyltransferase involved in cell wall biosynthesis